MHNKKMLANWSKRWIAFSTKKLETATKLKSTRLAKLSVALMESLQLNSSSKFRWPLPSLRCRSLPNAWLTTETRGELFSRKETNKSTRNKLASLLTLKKNFTSISHKVMLASPGQTSRSSTLRVNFTTSIRNSKIEWKRRWRWWLWITKLKLAKLWIRPNASLPSAELKNPRLRSWTASRRLWRQVRFLNRQCLHSFKMQKRESKTGFSLKLGLKPKTSAELCVI